MKEDGFPTLFLSLPVLTWRLSMGIDKQSITQYKLPAQDETPGYLPARLLGKEALILPPGYADDCRKFTALPLQ